ncbi:MAG: glycosyltransferase 87 family protein [Candidatus Aquilonibacter sp.]
MNAPNRIALAALVVLVAVLAFGFFSRNAIEPASFKAFYCAGQAIDNRANPYRVEPLRTCEHRVSKEAFPSYAVEPAPLPGYVLAPWAILARLPFGAAEKVYVALSVVALGAIGMGIAALTRLPLAWATLPFVAQWFLNIRYGEIPPFATAGIVLCAWALHERRWWLAALSAALVASEPHLAAPVWIALLLFATRVRMPLVVVGLALAVVDAAIGGPRQAIDYFSHVLPLQALSEVHANDQFSLTHQLALLNISDSLALLLGSVSYIVMFGIGLSAAWRLSAVTGNDDYLALAPPAFVLLGGTFVHDLQFMAALPLAVVQLARRQSKVVGVSALLLSIPWASGLSRIALLVAGASAAGVAWIYSHERSVWLRIGSACVTLVVLAAAFTLNLRPLPPQLEQASTTPVISATAWAPTAWLAYLEATSTRSRPSAIDLERKMPIWLAMILLLFDSLASTFRRAQPLAPQLAGAKPRRLTAG